ncbi:MAG: beta-ketoacyl-[acyl-carrier-protein] synthase family protein [Steroidobacteraceae bacterium]
MSAGNGNGRPPRVVISGIGVVSPFGTGRERFWEHVRRGISGTRAITQFDVSTYPCRVAAWVPPVSIEDAPALDGDDEHDGRADPKRYSRTALFGVVAGREAWRDAGLRAGEAKAGVLIGSGGGGIDVGERQYEDFFTTGGRHVTPYAIAIGICGMVSSEISISLGLRGISHVLSCGCTSSTDAIGYASALIRAGEYDVILSGGADGCVVSSMIFGFSRMRAVSTHYNERPGEASRPFDRDRDGFVLGEGAYMLVLEREDRARARGVRPYAVVEGYGSTCDAYHRVQMDPDGDEIVRCMQAALDKAGRRIEEIGYINYHGTSTQLNDAIESRCVRRVFGERADRVPGSSTKSMIGHPQGASGAAGVVATALGMTCGVLPPTINLDDPDPVCDMDFIPKQARASEIEAALCNCLGFGSKNSALVLGRA